MSAVTSGGARSSEEKARLGQSACGEADLATEGWEGKKEGSEEKWMLHARCHRSIPCVSNSHASSKQAFYDSTEMRSSRHGRDWRPVYSDKVWIKRSGRARQPASTRSNSQALPARLSWIGKK
eukprot:4359475-Pleurochrysis_carterae.AAC.1